MQEIKSIQIPTASEEFEYTLNIKVGRPPGVYTCSNCIFFSRHHNWCAAALAAGGKPPPSDMQQDILNVCPNFPFGGLRSPSLLEHYPCATVFPEEKGIGYRFITKKEKPKVICIQLALFE